MEKTNKIYCNEFGIFDNNQITTLEEYLKTNPSLPLEVIIQFNVNSSTIDNPLFDKITILEKNQDGTYHTQVDMLTDGSFAGIMDFPRSKILYNTVVGLPTEEN